MPKFRLKAVFVMIIISLVSNSVLNLYRIPIERLGIALINIKYKFTM